MNLLYIWCITLAYDDLEHTLGFHKGIFRGLVPTCFLLICLRREESTAGIALASQYSSLDFRDETLSGSELTAKLEPAFLSGLRCAQPLIRAKFFEVFDNSMKRRVYERLLYVTCSQNWEAMGNHFWIKQCIEVGWAWLTLCSQATELGGVHTRQDELGISTIKPLLISNRKKKRLRAMFSSKAYLGMILSLLIRNLNNIP